MGAEKKDLAKIDVTAGGLLPAALSTYGMSVAEIIANNFGGEPISPNDLERVKVSPGGSPYWMLSTAEHPEGEPKEEIVGVIVHARFARTYWVKGLDEAGGTTTPPDCYSDDNKTGIGIPGGDCESCPFNAWGSDPKGGKGKACAQSRLLFVVSPDSFLPRVITCPAGSLKTMRNYMARLSNLGFPFWACSTSFRLTKTKQKDGPNYYGVITPKMVQALSEEQVKRIREYSETLKPIFAQVKVEQSSVAHEEEAF